MSNSDEATRRLYQLFEEEWEYQLREFPEQATFQGDRRYNDRLTDYSPEAIQRRQAHDREVLKRIRQINREMLSPADQLNYDLFEKRYRERVERQRFHDYLMPVTQLWGPQIDLPQLVSVTPFEEVADYEAYFKRLAAVPTQITQITALMRRGMEEGWIMPREPLRGVADQIQAQLKADTSESVFYNPFRQFPEDVPREARKRLREQALKVLQERVLPAFQQFYDFFTGEYYPRTPEQVGAWMWPEGKAYYENRVRFFTTTNLTPEEIHQIGLGEVRRIRAEMEAIIRKVKFEGSFQEFVHFLRTDPQFYYTDPHDLIVGYRDICKRIDPELVKLFGKLPRIPYGVKEIPAYQAPTTYTGYYQEPASDGSRAGYFFANTYKLNTRPKYEMEALAAHEAVPGHHLQIALALELENLPKFRRHSSITAFVEGWALYAESLGEDLGLYQDPYSKFGQLTYEMWRACRLVVDTGMHYLKWTRQQAIDFMKENTAKTEHDITNEVDRYIVWPGQALAYKIGELKIKELRAFAEKELGERFDIREFHDRILENGAIPLDILEQNIRRYVAEKKAGDS
ncbi:MAG: DUF885 domain-containing protein [Calditrichaeota bacterium]|nr:MAG: DUF885 domain-containing protein [Calditrichota bacterium]